MILTVTDGLPLHQRVMIALGEQFVKEADAPTVSYDLVGTLQMSAGGWLILTVPNAFGLSLFRALKQPGLELPPGPNGVYNAHITVMSPEDIELVGGPDKITERGKQYAYTLGRLYTLEPAGWPEMEKVWYVRVHSPDLQFLRRSYGLSSLPHDGEYDFHVSVAVRRKGVLARNEKSKGG